MLAHTFKLTLGRQDRLNSGVKTSQEYTVRLCTPSPLKPVR